MNINWDTLKTCGIIGYLAGLLGFLPGILFSGIAQKSDRKFQSGILGFTGGLLIAFVCFEMLDTAFIFSGVFLSSAGLVLGLLAAFLGEGFVAKRVSLGGTKGAFLLLLGILMHSIPEGMAVGSVFVRDNVQGLKMAMVIAIHCLPEGLAYGLLKKSNTSFLTAFVLALPMAAGSLLGGFLSKGSADVSALLLSFAGGVMIYITCGEILPESKDLWRGRISGIGAGLGFIAGIILTA